LTSKARVLTSKARDAVVVDDRISGHRRWIFGNVALLFDLHRPRIQHYLVGVVPMDRPPLELPLRRP
jgi:hypothetical protein